MDHAQIKERLQALPVKPGVYLMKDSDGRVIYVGKAVRLRDRVRSYFQASNEQVNKVRRLAHHVADLSSSSLPRNWRH